MKPPVILVCGFILDLTWNLEWISIMRYHKNGKDDTSFTVHYCKISYMVELNTKEINSQLYHYNTVTNDSSAGWKKFGVIIFVWLLFMVVKLFLSFSFFIIFFNYLFILGLWFLLPVQIFGGFDVIISQGVHLALRL